MESSFSSEQRVSTRDLLSALADDDSKPWATYNRGRPLSPRQLTKLLEGYSIKPKVLRMGHATPRGFEKKWFKDAFDRYLPTPIDDAEKNETAQQDTFSQMKTSFYDVADDLVYGGAEIASATAKPLPSPECCGVADKNALQEREEQKQ